MEPSVAIDVPPQVERTRRMSALALRPPLIADSAVAWSLFAAQRLFGFGTRALVVLATVWIAWSFYEIVWDLRASRWRRHVRLRATSAGRLASFLGPAFLMWAYVTLFLAWPQLWLEPPGAVLTAVLWLPTVVMLGASWLRARWWPRLALAALYGTAFALLPLWMPVPARRFDTIALAQCLALAAWSLLDHVELRLVLRETGHEAEGETGGHA